MKNDRWSDEICGAMGLDQKYLPRIVHSNDICGSFEGKRERDGAEGGIPLVLGTGDKPAGYLGDPHARRHDL